MQWLTGTVFGGPTAQAFHDRVHAAGRLLLLTGDLAAYSSARRAESPAAFKQLFPGGSCAAWVPLSCTCMATAPEPARTEPRQASPAVHCGHDARNPGLSTGDGGGHAASCRRTVVGWRS